MFDPKIRNHLTLDFAQGGYLAIAMESFLTDHLGSTLAVLDSSGTVLSETRYMPFGAVRDDVGTISQTDFGYTF